jgi:hypothetical protein
LGVAVALEFSWVPHIPVLYVGRLFKLGDTKRSRNGFAFPGFQSTYTSSPNSLNIFSNFASSILNSLNVDPFSALVPENLFAVS